MRRATAYLEEPPDRARTRERDADAIVVGGGPAGAAAAARLARAGRRVILLERSAPPRDKICGDLLGTDAIAALRAFELGSGVLAAAAPLCGAVLHGVRGERYGAVGGVRTCASPRDGARVVPRLILDSALLDDARDAGATVVCEAAMGLLVGENGAVCGVRLRHGVLRAAVTVGADGWGSVVARSLGMPAPPPERTAVVVRAYASGVRGLADRMHFFVNAPGDGYGWIFPLPEGRANVGLGFIRSEPGAAGVRAAFARFCNGDSFARPYLREATFDAVAAWPIPLGPRRGPFAVPGALLAGDAASLASPLSGSGIANALRSGHAAARFALRAIEGDTGAWHAYATWIRTRLAPRLHVESAVHRCCATPQHVDRYAAALCALRAEELLSHAMLALG